MKRPRKIPLPRKRAAEKGRAGVDRPPVRLYRTAPSYCPRHAFWVGPGSEFANPFAADGEVWLRGAPIARLVDAAARHTRGPKPEKFGVLGCFEPPPTTPRERAVARAWLYREWRAGRLAAMPRGCTFELERVDPPLPAPPTDAQIRARLAGHDLVDETPDRWPSHADELLTIANSPPPKERDNET